MPLPEIKEGIAVLYPHTGPGIGHDRPHAHVIVTNPDNNGDVLLVPVCSFDRFADLTCVIGPDGGWEPVSKKSYIAYHHIKGASVKNINARMSNQEITYLGPVPAQLFERIKAGVRTSKETPEKFKQLFMDQQPKTRPAGRILRAQPPKS